MDLMNGTGEKLKQMYDSSVYEFLPNEVVRVSEDCGRFMLHKLKMKGLQEVKFGDDSDEISLNSLRAIVAFHRKQITTHELMQKAQEEKDFPPLDKPEGVVEAEARLKIYEPILEEREKVAQKKAQEKMQEQVSANLSKPIDMPRLEDMSVDELRSTLSQAGGNPGNMRSPKKLIAAIKKAQEE